MCAENISISKDMHVFCTYKQNQLLEHYTGFTVSDYLTVDGNKQESLAINM